MNADLGKHSPAIKLTHGPCLCVQLQIFNLNFNVKIHQTAKHWETSLYQKKSVFKVAFVYS